MTALLRESCIQHPAGSPFIMIRSDYLAITEKNHCAAAILAVFEHWHDIKLYNRSQSRIKNDIARSNNVPADQDADLWVYKKQEELEQDLLGMFGEKKIRESLKYLEAKGFLQTRPNPKFKWDRTIQYRFARALVQRTINSLSSTSDIPHFDGKQADQPPLAAGQNAEALPKIPDSKITTKDSSESSLSKKTRTRKAAPERESKDILVVKIQDVSGRVKDHPDHVYIGRAAQGVPASKWGNEFHITKPSSKGDGTRLEVVAKYLHKILHDEKMLGELGELRGKTLVCWCSPDLCHGNILAALADMDEVNLQKWKRWARDLDDPIALLREFMDDIREPATKAAYMRAKGDHDQIQANAARAETKKVVAVGAGNAPISGLYNDFVERPEPPRLNKGYADIGFQIDGKWMRHSHSGKNGLMLCGLHIHDEIVEESTPLIEDIIQYQDCPVCAAWGKSDPPVVSSVQQTPIDDKISEPQPAAADLAGSVHRKDSVRETIDAYYDGFPEAIRPTYRNYTGTNRQIADKWLMAKHTPAQMKAIVVEQYGDPESFWPKNKGVLLPMRTILEKDNLWVKNLSADPIVPVVAAPEESDEEFQSRLQERFGAKVQPGQPGWDRQIDRNLATWWQGERGQLSVQLNTATYSMYIKPLKLVEAHDNRFWFEVPNPTISTHIGAHLMTSMREALAEIGLKDKSRWNEIQITLEIEGQVESQLEVVATP